MTDCQQLSRYGRTSPPSHPQAERLRTIRENGESQRERECKPNTGAGKNPVWPTHVLERRLRYQRVEAFRFSSPMVSALLNLVDGCRKELFYFTQLFNLDPQHV